MNVFQIQRGKFYQRQAVGQLFNLQTRQGRLNLLLAGGTLLLLCSGGLQAAVTGAAFAPAYQFIYDAATGYLGRAIAIAGGAIGLGLGAAKGSALPAIVGVVLAVFGSLGPTIVDTIFNTAIV